MSTKEMILEAARQLFNEHRSTNVSTKVIAAEMGISPGNLYYHFRNKEEIIRCIYDQLSAAMDTLFWDSEARQSEAGIVQFYKDFGKLQKHYRFFYLELSVLVCNDPILLETYRQRSDRVMRQFNNVFLYWVSTGIMKKFKSDAEREMLVLNVWTLGQLWLTHADILDANIPPEVIQKGILRLHALLRPYFTAKTNKKMERLLQG
ncbi:MAG: TetR/AcrR family transcriptional regulator [Syntrophomonadaceae bacterium]|nr:TetR/AcrR family transcriptional regulator [Syntrophomonadaceae bacterium]MDD3271373.1 TetR/AcrR family transcriptional regulator [Syntrophomonadaceae bacterium]